jgi:hypothetical protein
MTTTNQPQPPLPPQIPPVVSSSRTPPPLPGDDPAEREPINGLVPVIECILRQPRRVMYALRQPDAWRVIASMVLIAIACALIYGLVVGTFSRGDQLWIAPLKIAAGLLVATLITLPSLYIFGCLSGSRARVSEMAGLAVGLLLLMTLLLIGFAPVAWLFSESTNSICWMGALHLAFWVIATMFGLRFLAAGFKATQARSRAGLAVWSAIFVLVALQMTAALRPILGTSDALLPTEKKFFLKHWADCAKASPTPAASEPGADPNAQPRRSGD